MKPSFDYIREFSLGQDEISMDGFLLDQDLKDLYYRNIRNQVFRWKLNQRQMVKHLNIYYWKKVKLGMKLEGDLIYYQCLYRQ